MKLQDLYEIKLIHLSLEYATDSTLREFIS
jgi:hypothetical protein